MSHPKCFSAAAWLTTLAAGLFSTAAAAAPMFGGAVAVSNADLAQMRGGFSMQHGNLQLEMSIGVEQLSYVNGVLKTATRLQNLSNGMLTLIQNGFGNSVAGTADPAVTGARNEHASVGSAGAAGTAGVTGVPVASPATDGLDVVQAASSTGPVVSALPSGMMGTVIQNSLDNQVISHVQVLNVDVNAHSMIWSMAVGDAMSGALISRVQ